MRKALTSDKTVALFTEPLCLFKSYGGGLRGQVRAASDLPSEAVSKPHQRQAGVYVNG